MIELRSRDSFADTYYWEELAHRYKIRLPNWSYRPTVSLMRKWLKRLQISVDAYLLWDGDKVLSDFSERNPDWPLSSWVGLLLEQKAAGRL